MCIVEWVPSLRGYWLIARNTSPHAAVVTPYYNVHNIMCAVCVYSTVSYNILLVLISSFIFLLRDLITSCNIFVSSLFKFLSCIYLSEPCGIIVLIWWWSFKLNFFPSFSLSLSQVYELCCHYNIYAFSLSKPSPCAKWKFKNIIYC